LADGQQIIQLVREGQPLAGSTITSISVSNDPLNNAGQVVYQATLANGAQVIGRVSIDELHWRSATGGAWDTNSNWTLSLTPSAIHDLYFDPVAGVTVTGPTAATTIEDLIIGALSSGIATLQLSGGGNLTVLNNIYVQGLGALDQQLGTLTADDLTNDGSLTQSAGKTLALLTLNNNGTALMRGTTTTTDGLINIGTFTLDQGTLSGAGSVTNDFGGLMYGRGTINSALINDGRLETTGLLTANGAATNIGQIYIALTENFRANGGLTNLGLIDLTGGAVSGTGLVTNAPGGIVQGNGAISASFSNQGLVRLNDGLQLVISNAFANSGLITLGGLTANLTGGAVTNTGTVSGLGTIGNVLLNSGFIRAEGGRLTLGGIGGTNTAVGQLEAATGATIFYTQGLASNSGVISLLGGRFDNNAKLLSNSGRIEGRGTVATGGLTNSVGGVLYFADGPMDIFGTVINNATLNVTNSTSTFFNAVTNNAGGTIKNTAGVTRFLGGLTNNGAFISDPADNYFSDLSIGSSGYLVGGTGDRFIVTDDFTSASIQSGLWDTRSAELLFQQGTDPHVFQLSGADLGGAVGGFANNYAWGTVRLATGQTLQLQDGNATPGGALFVRNFILDGGLSQLSSVSGNGMNIYYDPLATANTYLGGQTYNLQNGGVLAPIRALDVDGNQQVSALTDGVLLVRYLFGVRGTALTLGALGPGATRIDPTEIVSYLDQAKTTMLDVDANGTASALTDGVLLVRYLFGVRDTALILGAIGTDATRTVADDIETFVSAYTQLSAMPPAGTSLASASSELSAASTQSPAVAQPLAVNLSSEGENSAIAATQLSSSTVQSQPWVGDFLNGDQSAEDDELIVTF